MTQFASTFATHQLYPSVLGICAGFVGAYIVATMLNRVRYHKRIRRFAWLGLTSIYYGMTVWTTQIVLLTSYYRHRLEEIDFVLMTLGAVLALGLSSASLLLAYLSRRTAVILAGRSIVCFVVPLTYMINTTAYCGLWLPLPIQFALYAGHILLMSAGMRIYAMERQKKTLRPVTTSAVITSINVALHFSMLSAVGAWGVPVEFVSHDYDLTTWLLLVPTLSAAALTLTLGSLSIMIDSDSGREAAQRYRDLAMYDPLTGQANRLKLHATIDRTVEQYRRGDARMTILVMDLDNFKEVNDVHGHAAGDALLKGLAQDIVSSFNANEMLARLGGDEFVALKFDTRNEADARAFAEKVLQTVSEFDAWMTGHVKVGASIGVSIFPDHGNEAGELLSRADLAMYRAKQLGRNQVCLFDVEMDEGKRRETALALELRRAIEESALSLRLQPQFDSVSLRVVGFEALMQWSHPEMGPIPSGEVVPIAEKSGLIRQIGAWMLENACREAAGWTRPYRIAINIAPVQLAGGDLAGAVREALQRSGLAPSRLELEITETAEIPDDNRTQATLEYIRDLGVSIVMDDYGQGYSSLAVLRRLRFDKIKLDRSYVEGVEHDPVAQGILQSCVIVARTFDVPILVEGVETQAQLAAIRDAGCDEVQGFYFSRPVDVGTARAKYELMATTRDQFDADLARERGAQPATASPDIPSK